MRVEAVNDLEAKKLIFNARSQVVKVMEGLIDFENNLQTPKEAEVEITIGSFSNRRIDKRALQIAKNILKQKRSSI